MMLTEGIQKPLTRREMHACGLVPVCTAPHASGSCNVDDARAHFVVGAVGASPLSAIRLSGCLNHATNAG